MVPDLAAPHLAAYHHKRVLCTLLQKQRACSRTHPSVEQRPLMSTQIENDDQSLTAVIFGNKNENTCRLV
jgi:hypothetical protein